MNTTSIWIRVKYTLVLIILMAVSFVPIPITSTICLLLVLFRPGWFKKHVDKIYADKDIQDHEP